MLARLIASRLRTWFLAGSAAALLAAPAAAGAFSTVYVFGDSLVDVGNARIAASAVGAGDSVANPAQGYFAGRFSDGPVFVGYLSQQLTGELMTPALAGGTNYAFGGAQAVQGSELVPSLPLAGGGLRGSCGPG